MEQEGYNGWTNYETWCVALWLDNERQSYDYWRHEAADCLSVAAVSDQVQQWGWTIEEAASFVLASRLQEDVKAHPCTESATVYADLLLAALDAVNWGEIAGHMIEEIGGERAARRQA